MKQAFIILSINLLFSSLSVLLVHGKDCSYLIDLFATTSNPSGIDATVTEFNTVLKIKKISAGSVKIKYNFSICEETNKKVSGLVWDTEPDPSIDKNKGIVSYEENMNEIISELTGLTPSTTYYLNPYITLQTETIYGDEIIFTTAPANIGEEFQGGILAYVLIPGDPGYSEQEASGLVAAPYDQGTFEWGCYRNLVDNTSTTFGSGKANTVAIVSACGDGDYAAKICNDLVINGYNDWYLPSKDELNKLYHNRNAIGGFTKGNSYWTSSEFSPNHSLYQLFPEGDQYEFGKSSHLHVRAVRSF